MRHDDDNSRADDRQVVGRWQATSFEVGHNAFEFKVDCGRESQPDELVAAYFRLIASPINTRELFRLLGVGLLRYADRFGPIDGPGGPGGGIVGGQGGGGGA